MIHGPRPGQHVRGILPLLAREDVGAISWGRIAAARRRTWPGTMAAPCPASRMWVPRYPVATPAYRQDEVDLIRATAGRADRA